MRTTAAKQARHSAARGGRYDPSDASSQRARTPNAMLGENI
jgi:hypothetical protein